MSVEEEEVDGGETVVDERGEGSGRGGGAIAPGLNGEKGAKAPSLCRPCTSSHDGDEMTIAESFWGDGDLSKKIKHLYYISNCIIIRNIYISSF